MEGIDKIGISAIHNINRLQNMKKTANEVFKKKLERDSSGKH